MCQIIRHMPFDDDKVLPRPPSTQLLQFLPKVKREDCLGNRPGEFQLAWNDNPLHGGCPHVAAAPNQVGKRNRTRPHRGLYHRPIGNGADIFGNCPKPNLVHICSEPASQVSAVVEEGAIAGQDRHYDVDYDGAMRFRPTTKAMSLASYHPGLSPEVLAENRGFPLDVDGSMETPMPTVEELRILRE